MQFAIHILICFSQSLVGKVDIVVDKVRVDKSRVRLAEVQVGDDTGSISLRARDTQIDMLQEVSNKNGAIVLRNCSLELYQGKHLRLAVTKWGVSCFNNFVIFAMETRTSYSL
jgi:hypothetical protein